ncbi:hypothetical protein AAZX31_20G091100 [Glycine max]
MSHLTPPLRKATPTPQQQQLEIQTLHAFSLPPLVNFVGPFRLHSEPVMVACAAVGCDYLDFSNESKFIERMEATHHKRTVETAHSSSLTAVRFWVRGSCNS